MEDRAEIRAKAASLRKYEAAPVPWASDRGEPRLDYYSPFGPMIGKTRVAPALIDFLNRHIDTRIPPGQSGECHLPAEIVREGGAASLIRTTEQLITRYVQGVNGAAPRGVQIDVFWAVCQTSLTPSPVHFHSSDISGVMYLKTPEIADAALEAEKTYISNRQAGYINFIAGGRQEFARSVASFKPVIGDFYIFPGWLLHGAEPFRGTGDRRSVAFNAMVGMK